MYTLILVEDDQLICDGLSHFFPWKEIGFEFLGGFSDSLQAWDFIQSIAGKLEIVDYGKDNRLVNPYYVIVGGKL